MKLTDFQALSFDCYGTLIDWEAGIGSVLRAWADRHGVALSTEELLVAYADNEVVPGAVGLLLLVAEATDSDPRDFGGVNLVRALSRSLQ